MSEIESVPDLYRLAYMPGCWRCPKCQFILTKTTMALNLGALVTTPEDRQSEQCPNDATWMVPVTYRESLEQYSDRLKEEFDRIDGLTAELSTLRARAEAVEKTLGEWHFQIGELAPHCSSTRSALAYIRRELPKAMLCDELAAALRSINETGNKVSAALARYDTQSAKEGV